MTEVFRNPADTVDLIVEQDGKILLIERKHEPYKGCWALPGGFLDYMKENLEEAGVRELEEETCLKANKEDLILIKVSSDPKRDPRDHVISHAYVVTKYSGEPSPADDAANLDWFSLEQLPILAFDHKDIMEDYKKWKSKR